MSTTRTQPGRDLKKPTFNPNLPVAEQILSNAQASREVVQEFCPLAESLEWELGQEYLRERGNKAFISDASPVPFVINNDGTLSRNAAEVFFASLVEAEKVEPLEDEIFVLELGIGVGLFARYFLDTFSELCREHKKDYYDRLCYIAADRSPRMLMDVLRHGVLNQHVGRCRVRVVDAMEPEKYLARDVMFQGNPGKLRAVFLNYLLDCLPAAVLQFEGDEIKQLCVRTCVARNVRLADFTDMTVEMLQERAKSNDPKAKQELLEVYGLFASEYDYRPVDVKSLPHGAFAVEYAKKVTKRTLLSYGAIQCLDKLFGLLHERGIILANDYGQTQVTREDEFEHQRFSLATFVGVNFPMLKAYFEEGGKCEWVEPSGDSRGIHSRLLSRKLDTETRLKFREKFGDAAYNWANEPLQQARACVKVGRFELAATFYNEALKRQPRNWVLLNEVSMFLTFSLRDPKAGIDLAKVALALNPTCSAELWNALGDGLYEFGRTAEARSAYHKALAVNSSDVRSRYNLAWVYSREKNYPAALEKISEALALDKTGEFRERLLQKQTVHPSIRVEIVRTQTDLGIGDACRDALSRARGEYMVLLNNDTVVTSGWLNQLTGLLSMSAGFGVVGPMSNYAIEAQRVDTVPYRIGPRKVARRGEAESFVDVDEVESFAREFRESNKGKWLQTERLVGFCVMFKRELYKRLDNQGQLSQWTDLSLFDTNILGVKAREAGFNLAICRDLFIHHFGTRTFAQGAPTAEEKRIG